MADARPFLDVLADRRKAWRHMIQCALAEQTAREKCQRVQKAVDAGFEPVADLEAAEQELAAKGVCLDAALDALDDVLGGRAA